MRRLKVYQTVQPSGETPFGEQINLYTGDLTFRQADVIVEGTGPTISLVRVLESSHTHDSTLTSHAMGDWSLSIPRIETLTNAPRDAFPLGQPGQNWRAGADSTARCSGSMRPWMNGELDNRDAAWNGIDIITETGDRLPILDRSAQNVRQPVMYNAAGQRIAFPGVTQQNWQVGCLTNTSNGQVGEAFFVVSPDGTKYWFDHLTGERALTMKEQDPFGSGVWLKQHRMLARMYVSRIEDRFGNSLTYSYAGDRLTDITASDGRHVRIDWGDDRLIDSIWVQPGTLPQRIWHYQYAGGPKLLAAILPDQSRWTFDLQGLGGGSRPPEELSYCSTRTMPDPMPNPTLVSTVTSPSGLVGRFGVRTTWHARSYVASNCREPDTGRDERAPSLFQTMSLMSKEFSGPGMATRTWAYRYSPAVGSALFDPCALAIPQTCADTKWVEVFEPNGDMTRHVHSNRWGPMEGKQLWNETFAASAPSTLVRMEIFEYALPTQGPYPAHVGYNMVLSDSNTEPQETWTPLRKRTIYQQQRLFVWEVSAFDEYANTVTTTRSSNVGAGHVRSDTTVYAHYLNLWVIGQPASSTHLATGRIESRTVYDSMARPERTYSHEKLQQTVRYNTNGTIASVSDGRDTDNFDTTITLSDWKRGIPQSIQFPPTPDQPSGTRKSAEVDDHGWIKATIDENSYRTEYDHDAMGRLTQLRPPTGDTVAWNPTHQSFAQSASGDAAFGIPGGHWRQTISTGHARKVVYFDAQWRPVLTHEYDNLNPAATARFAASSYDTNGRQTYASYAISQAPAMSNGYWIGYMGGNPLAPYDPNDPADPPAPPEPPLPQQSTLPGTYTVHDVLDRAIVTTQTAEPGVTVRTLAEYLPGFQTRVTNARNKVTTTSYMAYDQPGTEWPVAIAHPADSYSDISRDAFGAPLSVTRRNGSGSVTSSRQYVYGIDHQLCKTIEPETGATVMAYDAANNLAWSASGQTLTSPSSCDHGYVAESAKVHRSYDARNRLKTLRFPDTRGDQDWEYLPDGLPRKVSTRNVTTPGASHPTNLYAYNKRRMLTTETLALPAWYTWSIGYDYDANGSLASQTYPSGQTVRYAPNALGQATQVSGDVPYASNVSYHPNGAIAAFGYGNGMTHSMTPNARQLPEVVVDQGALHMRYSYDANGNVDAIADYAGAGRQSRTMTYDDLDRLKTAGSPMFGPAPAEYDYDALDNLTRVRAPGRDHSYHYDAKWQLHDISNTGGPSVIGLGYDARGNVVNKSGTRFDFDHGNRLRETKTNTGIVIERYRYDAAGRRILANRMSGPPGSTGVVLSQYAQNGQLLYQSSDRTASSTDHIYLGGSLIAQREQPTSGAAVVKFIHTDALGSPVAVTNADATRILERMEYEPYGKALFGGQGTTAPKDGPGYTGHVLDVATGMNYMQQRYYDPGIGRFLSVDPMASDMNNAWNFNRYNYAANNPLKFKDPDGRVVESVKKGKIEGADTKVDLVPAVVRPARTSTVAIVVHRTVSNSAASAINSAKNSGGKASFHIVIDKDGTTTQIANLDNVANHVGKPTGEVSNKNSIGIEVVGNYNEKSKSWDPVTAAQVEATAQAIKVIGDAYGIVSSNVVPHESVSRKTAGEGGIVMGAIGLRLDELQK